MFKNLKKNIGTDTTRARVPPRPCNPAPRSRTTNDSSTSSINNSLTAKNQDSEILNGQPLQDIKVQSGISDTNPLEKKPTSFTSAAKPAFAPVQGETTGSSEPDLWNFDSEEPIGIGKGEPVNVDETGGIPSKPDGSTENSVQVPSTSLLDGKEWFGDGPTHLYAESQGDESTSISLQLSEPYATDLICDSLGNHDRRKFENTDGDQQDNLLSFDSAQNGHPLPMQDAQHANTFDGEIMNAIDEGVLNVEGNAMCEKGRINSFQRTQEQDRHTLPLSGDKLWNDKIDSIPHNTIVESEGTSTAKDQDNVEQRELTSHTEELVVESLEEGIVTEARHSAEEEIDVPIEHNKKVPGEKDNTSEAVDSTVDKSCVNGVSDCVKHMEEKNKGQNVLNGPVENTTVGEVRCRDADNPASEHIVDSTSDVENVSFFYESGEHTSTPTVDETARCVSTAEENIATRDEQFENKLVGEEHIEGTSALCNGTLEEVADNGAIVNIADATLEEGGLNLGSGETKSITETTVHDTFTKHTNEEDGSSVVCVCAVDTTADDVNDSHVEEESVRVVSDEICPVENATAVMEDNVVKNEAAVVKRSLYIAEGGCSIVEKDDPNNGVEEIPSYTHGGEEDCRREAPHLEDTTGNTPDDDRVIAEYVSAAERNTQDQKEKEDSLCPAKKEILQDTGATEVDVGHETETTESVYAAIVDECNGIDQTVNGDYENGNASITTNDCAVHEPREEASPVTIRDDTNSDVKLSTSDDDGVVRDPESPGRIVNVWQDSAISTIGTILKESSQLAVDLEGVEQANLNDIVDGNVDEIRNSIISSVAGTVANVNSGVSSGAECLHERPDPNKNVQKKIEDMVSSTVSNERSSASKVSASIGAHRNVVDDVVLGTNAKLSSESIVTEGKIENNENTKDDVDAGENLACHVAAGMPSVAKSERELHVEEEAERATSTFVEEDVENFTGKTDDLTKALESSTSVDDKDPSRYTHGFEDNEETPFDSMTRGDLLAKAMTLEKLYSRLRQRSDDQTSRFKQRLATMRSKNDSLRDENVSLANKVAETTQTMHVLQTSTATLEEQLSSMKTTLAQQRKERRQLNDKLEANDTMHASLKIQLRQTLDRLDSEKLRGEMVQQENDDLRRKLQHLNDCEKRLTSLKQQYSDSQANNVELKTTLESQRRDNVDMASVRQLLTDDIQTLNENLAKATEEKAVLQQKTAAVERNAAEKLSSLQRMAEEEKAALHHKAEVYKAKASTLEKEAKTNDQHFQSQIEKLSTMTDVLAKTVEEKATLQQQVKVLEGRANTWEQRYTRVSEAEQNANQELKDRIEELGNKLDACNSELETSKMSFANLEASKKEVQLGVTRIEEELAHTMAMIAEKDSIILDLQKTANSDQHNRTRLSDQLTALQEEFKEEKAKYLASDADHQQTVRNLKKKMVDLKRTLSKHVRAANNQILQTPNLHETDSIGSMSYPVSPRPLNNSEDRLSPTFKTQKDAEDVRQIPTRTDVSTPDNIYLKNVILKFLSARTVERKQLIPVLATILNFTPSETHAVRSKLEAKWF
eukprot:CFRG6116T1